MGKNSNVVGGRDLKGQEIESRSVFFDNGMLRRVGHGRQIMRGQRCLKIPLDSASQNSQRKPEKI